MKTKNNKTNTILISCGTLLLGTIIGGLSVKAAYSKYDNPYVQKIVDMFYSLKNDWLYAGDHENIEEYLSDLAIAGFNSVPSSIVFFRSL